MTKKVVAWGCWSNERSIAEPGQSGVLRPRLFKSRKAAEGFYRSAVRRNATQDDVIVRVTVEVVPEGDRADAGRSGCCPHGIHYDNACGSCIPPRGTKVSAEGEKS